MTTEDTQLQDLEASKQEVNFTDFDLKAEIITALKDAGYEAPSPIQQQAIPVFLKGSDIIGQAQTGTGKTAAFALPSLNSIDNSIKAPQILVLSPTRELALQVTDSYEMYAKYLKVVKVVAVYGGAPMGSQLRLLSSGAQVIVATPGRLVDHLHRNANLLSQVKILVLDEADEMLKLGFMDDLNFIFSKMPEKYQSALFSATLPPQIKAIAQKHLKNPVHIKITSKTQTVERIEQAYMLITEEQKIEAVQRILEVENFDALIAFVRTKQETVDVATALEIKGYKAAPLNGDIAQNQREKVIESLKDGRLDVVVATDVAARGIDVVRVTHVLNIDIPYDPESYIHRIGRTGRAGRTGKAILLVTPREKRMLSTIERATKQPIQEMPLPSAETIAHSRFSKFVSSVHNALNNVGEKQTNIYNTLLNALQVEPDALNLAIIGLLTSNTALSLEEIEKEYPERRKLQLRDSVSRSDKHTRDRIQSSRYDNKGLRTRSPLGTKDGIAVRNILGAILNETDIQRDTIGKVQVRETFSLIEFNTSNIEGILAKLANLKVNNKPLDLRMYVEKDSYSSNRGHYNSNSDFKRGGRSSRERR